MKIKHLILPLCLLASAGLLMVAGCKQELSGEQKAAHLPYEKMGLDYALATKAVLGKNLITAISTQGVENAIGFCNEKAYPLTDSMATVLHANIKRVSDKNRNAGNAADAKEVRYIESCRQNLAKGEPLKPELHRAKGKVKAYYPILIEQLCLQCHGTPETEIAHNTLEKIRVLYPADKAVGYKENEIRGIWVVEMDEK